LPYRFVSNEVYYNTFLLNGRERISAQHHGRSNYFADDSRIFYGSTAAKKNNRRRTARRDCKDRLDQFAGSAGIYSIVVNRNQENPPAFGVFVPVDPQRFI
jgi:hypothetical protein